jgi:hypothetical protein
VKPDSARRRRRKSPEIPAAGPKRGNSIVDAAYSAAMFSDRNDPRLAEPAARDVELEDG